MPDWVDVKLNKKLFKNVDEVMLTGTFGALENCFVTESNGLSRFPGLKEVVDLDGDSDIHLSRYQNDLLAVGEDGQAYTVDSNFSATSIEGTPVSGGERVSFARTRDGVMMAAGAQIIKFPCLGDIGIIDFFFSKRNSLVYKKIYMLAGPVFL